MNHPNIEPRSHYQSSGDYPHEGDTTSFLDLFLILLRYKTQIILLVSLSGVAAVIISLLMTNIYRAEATIAPRSSDKSGGLAAVSGLGAFTGGMLGLDDENDLSKLEVVLKSNDLAHRLIQKYDLLPILFDKEWDAAKKQWLKPDPPTEQDAFKLLDDILAVRSDIKKNVIEVKFDHRDPVFAKDMVERYLNELSESLRENTIKDAQQKQKFFHEQLNQTSDALLKEKIYSLLSSEIEKETFARASRYYTFDVLDPPIVPDIDKKVKPRPAIICILTVMTCFVLSMFGAFFLNYLEHIKSISSPQQLEQLDQYMPFRRWRNKKSPKR